MLQGLFLSSFVRATVLACWSAQVRALAAHIFAAMLGLASITQGDPAEDLAARTQRWRAISVSIASAAIGSGASDADARWRAAVLLGIARHESGPFSRDVDIGPCRNAAAHCDHGRSVSIFQIFEKEPDRRAALQADRDEAAREALRRARASMGMCQGELMFGIYAAGSCAGAPVVARELLGGVMAAAYRIDAAVRRAEDPYD